MMCLRDARRYIFATNRPSGGGIRALVVLICLGIVAAAVSGCATAGSIPPIGTFPATASADSDLQLLSPGDVIKIAFPGAPNLDSTQQIRRDGRINLAVVGEVKAADKTPVQLETDLMGLYASQIVSKEIKVTVVSSSFAVFVSGAVLKPGKISPERMVTVLEAIMEAGGFDSTKANLKAVVVIRNEGAQTRNFVLNLQKVLQGGASEPFYLRSHDIVYVPEKFSWF